MKIKEVKQQPGVTGMRKLLDIFPDAPVYLTIPWSYGRVHPEDNTLWKVYNNPATNFEIVYDQKKNIPERVLVTTVFTAIEDEDFMVSQWCDPTENFRKRYLYEVECTIYEAWMILQREGITGRINYPEGVDPKNTMTSQKVTLYINCMEEFKDEDIQ